MDLPIIDAHVHCGRQCTTDPRTGEPQPQALADYRAWAEGSAITGAVMFSPVPEIYDRLDPEFEDDPSWQQRRKESNEYVLSLSPEGFAVFPLFFIWNDFAVEQLSPRHLGIKWHRHADEPHYHYDDPRCAAAIAEIRRRDLPVCLEEEWEYTRRFLTEWAPGVRVIIPHCGGLNGGYEPFASRGLWENPLLFTDISNAPDEWVLDYVQHYGHDRIMFGSDFPFSPSSAELMDRFRSLGLSDEARAAMAHGNVRRMLTEGRSR
jgi:predicted TIM-barrel fold metal-dependent hydrolase